MKMFDFSMTAYGWSYDDVVKIKGEANWEGLKAIVHQHWGKNTVALMTDRIALEQHFDYSVEARGGRSSISVYAKGEK